MFWSKDFSKDQFFLRNRAPATSVGHVQEDDKIAEILAAIQSKNLFKIAVDPRDTSFDFWQKGGKIVSDVNGRFPKGD